MKMIFRWFGAQEDTITLEQIKQIPGVRGVVPALFDIPVGEVWSERAIKNMLDEIHQANLSAEVIESVNISDDIKNAGPLRDQHIANYQTTIRNLSKYGVKVICYNFMPIFDWLRTDLAYPLSDGSQAMAYFKDEVPQTAEELIGDMETASNGFSLPGWEKERLSDIESLFKKYQQIDNQQLFENLVYFLKAIIPVCEEVGVKMALHPDDPSYPLFELPKIVSTETDLLRIVHAVDSPANGITLCTGSLGSNPENDLISITEKLSHLDRIPFLHLRNIKFMDPQKQNFHEASHLTADGSIDMYGVIHALVQNGWDGYVRPDHGRMIWGEDGRPGYGLYDRALGVAYLNGLFEAEEKNKKDEA
ncbi:mannonate dehydratase [Weissella coleopterorum]|uniref:Mannonate dehydratase n=1 Tax=Weissella coleopterorum TaxID=2714949 RepID=A0A6G8B211_9LACO|nr:mannonate dehydratase [Weissella coleopterorum]QIL51183.1 mannonate dehydratase [Weissella coleopterorum]